MSFSKTKYQKSYHILGLTFAVIMVSFFSAPECQAVTLTITATNGSVRVNPEKADYDVGEVVELIPKPDTGYYFTGWAGDAQGKRLVLNLTMDSDKAIAANFDTWRPPIGIPEPEFGIFETHHMYEGHTYDFGSGPEPYKDAGNGPYTHYVDNTHPDATDTDNPYGTPDKPRKTIPHKLTAGVLPAGSVVEVHGGPYTYWIQTAKGTDPANPTVGFYGGQRLPINGEGTAEKPIFIRGINTPVFVPEKGSVWVEGSYIVIENIKFNRSILLRPKTDFAEHTHHVAIRNSDMDGGAIVTGWPHGASNHMEYRDPTLVNDIVIYNNQIHDVGVWDSTTTNKDSTGVNPRINSKYIWILDNHIYYIESDAIQINTYGIYDDPALQQPPMHIYIGRNDMHHNQENTLDIKVAYDVIVSQNTLHGIHAYLSGYPGPKLPGSDGTAVVVHEDHGTDNFPYPERLWFIFNEVYDSDAAFRIQTSDDVYIIGNSIHDIIASYPLLESSGYSSGGVLQMWDEKNVSFINNVVYNTDLGILAADYNPGAGLNIVNNIIANLSDNHFNQFGTTGYHIFINQNAIAERSFLLNNLLYQNGNPVRIKWSSHPSDLPVYPEKDEDSNFRSNPLFVDAANNNFNLLGGSPAIDNGTLSDVYATFESLYGIDIRKDIEGKPRTGAWDIGVYEYVLNAITDLSVSGTSQNSVTLTWTVPGEEGYTGKPARYDIRYATSPLTEANWDTATQVQGEPVPVDFGDEQSFTITGLNPGTTYYIAIKTSNDTGSTTSPLSNVISRTTDTSGNHAPVLEPIGDQSLIENEPFTLVISATDADAGDTLTYSATNIPTGASFAPATQTFTWTPTSSQSGTYQVTFQVTDSQVTVSETITITVTGIQSTLTFLPTIGGSTIPVEGSHSYDEGTVVSIQATAVDNYHFVEWTGTAVDADKVANPNAASTTVTADADYTIQANFAIDQRTLTISSTSGGSVTNPGEGTFQYDHGTDVSILATADGGNYFVNWTGTAVAADKVANPNAASTTITADADYTIQANFGQQDGIAPTVTNCSPAAGDIQVPLNSLIILHVTDAGIGVKASSVIIRLDGDIIYTGGDTYYDSATGTCRRIGTIANYTYAYQSSQTFDFDESKTVTVNATDLGGIAMTEKSYSFRTEMRSFGQNKQVDSTVEGLDKADPSTARDSNGNIWAVWHAGQAGSRDIYVAKLSVNEEYFGDINKIRGSTSDQCNPVIAIGSDNKLYVAWQDNRQADDNNQGDWDIYVSTSVDGVSWSSEARVNDPNIGNQVNPAIVIDGQDFAHVVWQDDSAGNQDIWIATSSDGFVTKTVSQITSDAFDQIEPAVAADSDNTIYVVWTDGRNGSNDIYGAASNNPWTNVAIVSNANDQSSPAIAAESAGSILHLLWVDDTSGDNDIYYASSDGLPGSPLTGSSIIIDDTSGADQLDPTIAVTGSTDNNLKVFACWQDWRNTDTDLWFVELSYGAGPNNIFVGDDGSNTYQGEPVIGIDEYDHPYLVWVDGRGTNTEIYFAGSTFIEPVALASELVTASAPGSTTVGTYPPAITTIDDASIVVPAGACSYNVAITVAKIANLPAFAAPCLGGYDFGPSGIQFSQPVTITIPYVFSGSDGSAKPYWFSSLTGTLSQQGITDIQDITISPSLHALSFKTTHFTAFYLFAGTAALGGGGGGGGGCSVSASGEGNIVEFILPYGALALFMLILRWRDRKYRKDFGETLYRENE